MTAVSIWIAQNNRQVEHQEQQLYDHLLNIVQTELPSQLVHRFRMLFVDGSGYPDPEIMAALDKIVASKLADQEFRYVLNRCCHILINRWQARPQFQSYISDLVDLFEAYPQPRSYEYSRSKTTRRLRELVHGFTDSEQYLALRRLSQVISQTELSDSFGQEPVGTLIRRYPYLYEHCLLVEGSTYEQQQTVRQLRDQAQRQYEINLSQYAAFWVRRVQIARNGSSHVAQNMASPVRNPTLLQDRELLVALKHYAGKSQGSSTYRDVAQRFLTHTGQTSSFRSFKDDLYQYVTASVDSEYGQRQFNNQLYQQLQSTLPESDSKKVNDFLMVRTCSQLLSFLTVESAQNPNHYLFVDLNSNLGPISTTGLLLKIVLLCRKVKPYLEKRFSILFNHYESTQRDTVQWLVQAMEHLNLALSTNFSTMDLSFVNQW